MDPFAYIADCRSDQEEGMKNLIAAFLNKVMIVEALQQTGAIPYARTDSRKAHRNGYKDRSLTTRFGEMTLRKPQFREFPFEAQVFGWYARAETAIVNVVVESYLQGVSTRRVQEIVAHLGIEQLSPASVSRMAKDLDDPVQAFLLRPIEQAIPYLFVDASYSKVREGVRYVTKVVLGVAGVREDGSREILGARMTDCENEAFWSGLFEDLKGRGLLLGPAGHLRWAHRHSEGGLCQQRILADASGSLHLGGVEEYSPKNSEKGGRVPEEGVWEGTSPQELTDDLNVR